MAVKLGEWQYGDTVVWCVLKGVSIYLLALKCTFKKLNQKSIAKLVLKITPISNNFIGCSYWYIYLPN